MFPSSKKNSNLSKRHKFCRIKYFYRNPSNTPSRKQPLPINLKCTSDGVTERKDLSILIRKFRIFPKDSEFN